MKRSLHSLLLITLCCLGSLAVVQLWNGLSWAALDRKISSGKKNIATAETLRLISALEKVITDLERCRESSCSIDSSDIADINYQLKNFTSIVAQEKSNVNLVGAMEYAELRVSLQKYTQKENDQQLLHELVPIYIALQNTYQDLLDIHVQSLNQDLSERFELNMTLFILLFIVTLISIFLYDKRISQLKKEYEIENRQFERFSNRLDNLTIDNIEKSVNQLGIAKNERKIYSHLLELHKKNELEKRNSDLYRQLYTLIGYEIRGIGNTIECGVKLLVQDTDENGAVIAKEISSVTATLSELADNYNEIISQGATENKNASLASLISNLVVHLKAKALRQQIQVDCYIEDNLPNVITTNATRLFWVLFLQLSNAMVTINAKCTKLLVHVYSSGAQDIEKFRLTFDVIFLQHDDVYLDSIIEADWQLSDEQHNSQDSWSKQILSDVSHLESSWFYYEEHQKKRLQIDVTPINFIQVNDQLQEKKILVCADSKLQISIIKNVLERFNCEVEIAHSPNDVFKNLPDLVNTDAIIVTDTIKGIELKSFCKTLKSRMKKCPNTQLLLAVSEASAVQSAHEYIDWIFYTPLLPHEFIPNIVEVISQKDTEDVSINNQFLVVEDDRVQQFLLKQLLKKQNYEADTVSTGEEAVEYFKSKEVNIIFMDCIMPGMGGLNATKMIRSIEKNNPTRNIVTIIGSTALTSSNEHKSCIDAGMDFVISKPYKSEEIAKVIKKYLAVQKII